MVNKKQPPPPAKKSPVIAEPALANRPKRNISPKSWDNSSVLSWREEQELKKALYASLQEVKRQSSDPGEQTPDSKDVKTGPKETRKSRETVTQYKKTRSVSTDRPAQKPHSVEMRRHSAGATPVTHKKNGKSMSAERELRSRSRLSSPETSNPVKLDPQLTSLSDETSKDSVNSLTTNSNGQETKRKYRAQRKFAQMHGYGYGYCYTPNTTPVKQTSGGTPCRTPPVKVFPKRAKTEDFLTFLCLRGTHALPPHLDMYNFTREDSNGADSSYPATPSNGRRPGSSARESSPSSSSTSVSQDDGFCPISPLKTFITPTKKAARASAGTPEIARGLATRTRHTKNSQRTAFGKTLDVTPVKGMDSSPGKRKSPSKLSPAGSPTKMAKSDRIKMKKKAVATLTSLDKRSRKKSLFMDEQGEQGESSQPKKRIPKDQLITTKIRPRLKRAATNVKKRKKSEDFIASRLPPRKARHSDFCLYVDTDDLDESIESKSPTPVFEPERRKRKMENRIDVDDEISLKVPIKQSRLFKSEMKSRKPKLKENIRKQKKLSKLKKKGSQNKNDESHRISTRASTKGQPDSNLSSSNMFVTQKLKKLKKFNKEKQQKMKNVSEMIARKKDRKEKQTKFIDSGLDDLVVKIEDCKPSNEMSPSEKTQQENVVVRKKGRSPVRKATEVKAEPVPIVTVEPFPGINDKAAVVDVPTYHPSEEEFSDPIRYLKTVSSKAKEYGMCKIVPPESWKIEGKINEDIRFVTQRQITNRLHQRYGPNALKMECIQNHLESHGIIEPVPVVGGIELDLVKLSKVIKDMGGMHNVVEKKKWQKVADIMGIHKTVPERGNKLYEAYCRFLVTFDTMSDSDRQQLEEKVKDSMMKNIKNYQCCVKGKNMTLAAFNKMAKNIATAYTSDENIPIDQIEKQYWEIVNERDRHIVVHSGNVDTHKYHCSGFSAKKDSKNPWNLNKLHQKSGSVLQYLGPLQGVTIPVLHIGMLFSTSCWSTSTQLLPFVQYLHTGSDVVWYSVPQQEASKFQSAVKSYLNEDGVLKPNSLMMPPSELNKRGVSISRCVQKPREFVVVFPQCYSANVCSSNTITESVYYALPDWLSAGLAASQKLDGMEKEPFSMDELLCKIVEDNHASKELLSNALPVFQQIVDKELSLRTQLQEAGLKMSRRMCTNLGHIKTSPGGTSRCMDDVEEIVTFCETSKKVCYLSMVLNEADDLAFRPEYGLQHIQKKKNIKSCIFMYRHTNEELREIVFNATERLKIKDSPDSASKRKRKSV